MKRVRYGWLALIIVQAVASRGTAQTPNPFDVPTLPTLPVIVEAIPAQPPIAGRPGPYQPGLTPPLPPLGNPPRPTNSIQSSPAPMMQSPPPLPAPGLNIPNQPPNISGPGLNIPNQPPYISGPGLNLLNQVPYVPGPGLTLPNQPPYVPAPPANTLSEPPVLPGLAVPTPVSQVPANPMPAGPVLATPYPAPQYPTWPTQPRENLAPVPESVPAATLPDTLPRCRPNTCCPGLIQVMRRITAPVRGLMPDSHHQRAPTPAPSEPLPAPRPAEAAEPVFQAPLSPAEVAAAKIKADELSVNKRRAAVRYLGKVDCHFNPEAEAGLLAALRTDRSEVVRFEAALAMGCGSCCTQKILEALHVAASGSNRDGHPAETSERVRWAALEALHRATSLPGRPEEAPSELPPPAPLQPAGYRSAPPPAKAAPAPAQAAPRPSLPDGLLPRLQAQAGTQTAPRFNPGLPAPAKSAPAPAAPTTPATPFAPLAPIGPIPAATQPAMTGYWPQSR